MKTIVFCILIALSYNYCNAQLKVENSTPQSKEKLVYDLSKDIYIKSSYHNRDYSVKSDYEFYNTFINKRLFCISDNAFSGNKYVFEMQVVKIDNPIKACLFYKKKGLPYSIDFVATHLYKPCMTLMKPNNSVLDDMRGGNLDLNAFLKDNKKKEGYMIRLYNYDDYKISNEPMHCAGKFYTIRRVLTRHELVKLLRENPDFVLEVSGNSGKKYYESKIYDKFFITESVKDNILIVNEYRDLKDSPSGNYGEYSEPPFFLLEDESGEQFVTRLNMYKEQADFSSEKYTSYVIEEHIEYLKSKYIGKSYKVSSYALYDWDDGKPANKTIIIQDIVIRDNMLSAKFYNTDNNTIDYSRMVFDKNSGWQIRIVGWAEAN